ncbi:MAG TPA: UMP kinase [bacterium]|nr:UMP kinase [bacterium]
MPKKRILLKLSGELFRSHESALDLEKVLDLAKEIIKIRKSYDLGIVFGGGNIFRGREIRQVKLNMATAHYIGMTATLVNALALKSIFDSLKVPSRVISALNFSEVIGVSNNFDIDEYFKQGEILIFAGGTGNPFVTTDTAAVIRGLEIGASVVLKGTKVAGIFDANPEKNSTAKQYAKLSYADYTKIPEATILDKTAVTLAEEHHLPIYVFKWGKGILAKAVGLKAGGTLIN